MLKFVVILMTDACAMIMEFLLSERETFSDSYFWAKRERFWIEGNLICLEYYLVVC